MAHARLHYNHMLKCIIRMMVAEDGLCLVHPKVVAVHAGACCHQVKMCCRDCCTASWGCLSSLSRASTHAALLQARAKQMLLVINSTSRLRHICLGTVWLLVVGGWCPC